MTVRPQQVRLRRRGILPAMCFAISVVVIAGTALEKAWAANASLSFSGRVTRDIATGLSPLSAETVSFANEAGFRLIMSNPSGASLDMRLGVYDNRFRRINAETFPAYLTLGAGASSLVTVIVPFDGAEIRDLNICAERIVAGGIERQACGQYTIRRVTLD
jgi:hypothetical protein